MLAKQGERDPVVGLEGSVARPVSHAGRFYRAGESIRLAGRSDAPRKADGLNGTPSMENGSFDENAAAESEIAGERSDRRKARQASAAEAAGGFLSFPTISEGPTGGAIRVLRRTSRTRSPVAVRRNVGWPEVWSTVLMLLAL